MRIFRGWAVVAGSALGIGTSAHIFVVTGYTILAAAISAALGWSLTDLATGATFYLFGQIIGFMITGILVDRWGTLRVVMVGLVMNGLHLFLLSRVSALWQLYAVMLSMGVFGAWSYTPSYLRAVALWFSRRRGMAVGLAAAGMGIGGAGYPLVTQRLVEAGGWTYALMTLSGFILLVCLPLIALTVRDEPRRYGLWPDGDSGPAGTASATQEASVEMPGNQAPPELEGLTFAETVRTLDFWLIATVFMVTAIAIFALLTNAVHILSHTASLDVAQVAKVQAFAGLAVLIGRLAGGVMLDYINAKLIGVAMNMLLAIAIIGYAYAGGEVMAIIAAFALGFATGGEGDVLPYMLAKYFGNRAFGKTYGAVAALFGIGTAIGPVAYGWLYSLTGDVRSTLIILAIVAVTVSGNFLLVGRQRNNFFVPAT